jgi:chromosome partitioning protein
MHLGKETCLSGSQLSRYGQSMMIVCANSKGGVGKSTLATHLAVWLFDQGFQTALIDTDKQRSSSQWIAEVEPQIEVRVADTPEECLINAQELISSHDFVVGDAPGGLEDLSRTLLILADLAIFPISPSILDVRSVAGATQVLRYAQGINGGKPDGRLILNKMKTRDTISHELKIGAPKLGLQVAQHVIRDLQAYRDAAQQGTVVGRFGRKGAQAAADIDALFMELLAENIAVKRQQGRQKVENG